MPRLAKSYVNTQPPYTSHLSPHQVPPSPPKKKHVCSICERAFTTSGHLARHSRVHTGERNHKCPFPGCETRCSRQDNLQQHYRIHLSPGSRRNSARTSAARKRASASMSSTPPTSAESSSPQHPGTPPLNQSRLYTQYSTPAASTPPLTQATLPAISTPPHPRMEPDSGRVSATSSPGISYASDTHHILPVGSPLSLPVSAPLNYSYRSETPSYHDQTSYGSFVNTAASGTNGTHDTVGGSNFTYSNYGGHSQQHSRSASPSAMPSRHSISHINNPQYSSSHRPPSPISVSSHTPAHSGPPTPTYPVSYSHTHSSNQAHNTMLASQSIVNNGQLQSQPHHFQNPYTPNGVAPRYLPPPLILAPIQDDRYIRRLDAPRHTQSQNSGPYFRHSQPLPDYSYHHPMSLGHGSWKTEGMRKGIGAVI